MARGVLHPVRAAQAALERAAKAGTKWRANFYRMDYDEGKRTQWEWSRVGTSFHDFQNFGELVFAER